LPAPVTPVRDAAGVNAVRVRFEGPSTVALQVATELADADGIDLISSEPPSTVGEGTVALTVVVEGTERAVAEAVSRIRELLPGGTSLEALGGG